MNGVSAYALTVPVSGVTLASDLCGWIDFDRNGAFETAERACASVGIGGTSANLSWTMPVSTTYVAGNSYLRLRLGTTTGQVGSPTGATDSGEVEDYTVSLLPRVRLVKALSPTTDPGLFNLSITPTVSPAGSALSTDQGNNGSAPATAGTFAPVGLNTAITISETAGTGTALTSYNSSRACVNRAGGVVLAAGAGSSGSFTSMTSASTGTNLTPATTTNINDTEVICTITNGVVVDLSVTKTNTPGVNGNIDQADDTLTSGSLTTYEVRVTNNGPGSVTGAVVTDTPGAGVTCPGGNAVTITGDGIPAGAFTVGNLTSTGIALGTLNNGQAATLSFTCTVQ